MSDATEPKPERTHLPVLPHSGKVDQLRQEAAMSSAPIPEGKPHAGGVTSVTPVPATVPSSGGHTNRITPVPPERKTIEYKLLEGKLI
jgi:hypothetical protein